MTELEKEKRRPHIETLAEGLRKHLSNEARVIEGSFERGLLSTDVGRVPPIITSTLFRTRPLLVVQPRTEQDIVEVLDLARSEGMAVFPRGISSSAFGGAIPTAKGIALDLSTMARIVAIDEDEGTVTVEPGVRWADLSSALERIGCAPMTTPTSRFSTVGGWASTGGIGVESFRYGPFSEALVAARVVTPARGVLELASNDPTLADCIGSEGQLGVFSQLTLRTRPVPESGSSHLLYFDDVFSAFKAVEDIDGAQYRPSHVVFFDKAHMKKEKQIVVDRFGPEKSSGLVEHFQTRDALLVHCDSVEAEERLRQEFGKNFSKSTDERDVGASYLWADRYFPLKGQRLGPNLLATEVVLEPRSAVHFVEIARRLGRRFGARIGFEATVSRDRSGVLVCVIIAAFGCDTTRRLDYLLRMILVQILTHAAVRVGGRPYGVGVWNTPFKLSDRRRALTSRKEDHDPDSVLNPHKFFGVGSRLFNLPALLFHPWVLVSGLWLALLASPLLGLFARILRGPSLNGWDVPSVDEDDGERLLTEAEQRCTLCGACVSTCPAYLITHDEQVSGRSKLRLAKHLIADTVQEVSPDEAHSPFQCLRCGLCEEVCQTRLPLRECYLAVEERLLERFGKPGDKVDTFIERLEANKEWIERTFGVDLPEWTPGGRGLASADGLPKQQNDEVES